MPEHHSYNQQSSILEEAERIVRKKGFPERATSTIPLGYKQIFRVSPPEVWTQYLDYWNKILTRARYTPPVEFVDEFASMKSEIDTLRNRVKLLEKEVYEKLPIEQTKLISVNELCKAYIEIVSAFDIVHKVLLVEDEDVATIWTIIDAPQFEDSFRTPIYEAQLKILRSIKEDLLLDFHVLNVSELSEEQNIDDIIPSSYDVLWQR